MDFKSLPTEIQLLIMSYFSHDELENVVAPVCNEWETLAFDPSLWLKLILDRSVLSMDLLVKRWKRATKLRDLKFKFIDEWACWLTESNKCGGNLRCLKFEKCTISLDVVPLMKLFVEQSPLVNHVIFKQCSLNHSLFIMLRQWKNLKILEVNDCSNYEKKLFYFLITGFCRNLEELNLNCIQEYKKDDDFPSKSSPFLRMCNINPCNKLSKLILRNSFFEDEELVTITMKCPLLKELEISGNSIITDAAVKTVVNNLKNLEILRLINNKNITKSTTLRLLRQFYNLLDVEFVE